MITVEFLEAYQYGHSEIWHIRKVDITDPSNRVNAVMVHAIGILYLLIGDDLYELSEPGRDYILVEFMNGYIQRWPRVTDENRKACVLAEIRERINLT